MTRDAVYVVTQAPTLFRLFPRSYWCHLSPSQFNIRITHV